MDSNAQSFNDVLRTNDLNIIKQFMQNNNYTLTSADMCKLLLTSCIRDDDIIQYLISKYYHSGQLMRNIGIVQFN